MHLRLILFCVIDKFLEIVGRQVPAGNQDIRAGRDQGDGGREKDRVERVPVQDGGEIGAEALREGLEEDVQRGNDQRQSFRCLRRIRGLP